MLTTRLALGMILLTGCSHWVAQSAPPRTLLSEETPDLARVALTDGREVEIASPRIRDDSLHGIFPRSTQAGTPLASFSIPLDSVQYISIKERDFVRTVSVVTGPPVLLLGSLFLMGF